MHIINIHEVMYFQNPYKNQYPTRLYNGNRARQ